MNKEELGEVFRRYEGNPILTPDHWPYKVNAVFNPGAVKFENETLLLVRAEDRQGYSHLTLARSKDGRTNWQISSEPTLKPDRSVGEEVFGLEDARITWLQEREIYVIAYVSFMANVAGEPPSISLITTKDFSKFERLGRQLVPPNKDASLFPKTINGRYALTHRPLVEGRADIWVCFSPDLKHWGDNRVLIAARHRSWDGSRVGIGPPPIETPEGWLIIYHGVRVTASGSLYRVGLALLDLDTLNVTHRSKEWVFGPKEIYEKVGDTDGVIFPCGGVVDEKTNELLVYYGACDSAIGLAVANLDDILTYLKACPGP
ncbi:Beta-1,4-mannooligosaccharide phosphorylase [subsurface metagenome]